MSRTSAPNRRRFLQAAAAAAGLPHVIPAAALGRNGAVAPSGRIAVGCIGTGNQGCGVMGNFLHEADCRVVAVCDVKTPELAEAQRRVNQRYASAPARGCKIYGDFRELLARDDLDAVLVATPDHWHVLIALAAARAGKDVYLEKPIGVSMTEAQALRAALRRYGTVFQFGTQQRSSAHFRRACELVRNGRIGALREINVWSPGSKRGGSTKVVPVPKTLDYDMWLGPAPFAPYTEHRCSNSLLPGNPYKVWPFISDYCLGWVSGWGVHPLDIALWGGGDLLTGPLSIHGAGEIPTSGLCDTAVNWDLTLEYDTGARLNYKGEPAPDPWRRRYGKVVAHGTAFEGADGWVHVNRSGLWTNPRKMLDAVVGPSEIQLERSANHVRNFLDCVKSRAKPICSIDEAFAVETLCQLSAIVIRLERQLRWDPRAERFVDDAEADRLLSRAMRGPWHL